MEQKRKLKRKQGKKQRKTSRLLSLFVVFSMAFTLFGCGKDGVGSIGQDTPNALGGNTQQANGVSGSGDAAAAMGRYVETEIDLSEQLFSAAGFCMREDGSLVILDRALGFLVSQDGGATWNVEMPDWFAALSEKKYYVSELAMTPNGTVGVVYDTGDSEAEDYDFHPVMDLVLPDGTVVPVEGEFTGVDNYVRQVVATKDNRLIIRESGANNLYEVKEDGSMELLMEADEYFSRFYMEENIAICDMEGRDRVFPQLYDVAAEQFVEDEVLLDFVDENYADRYYNGSDYGSIFILPEDDSVLYLFGAEGIHRHAIGGNMMEQIVDGNLSMLSNPSYGIVSALMTGEDEFLVLFSNHKLIRFTYDPNVPTVPANVLTIYSLEEDEDMRQAISMYQSRNPDVFVSYEIGMADGAVTKEDAIKKLNTEVMAGTGPDLIVMDNLPFTSYVEKGLLLDLTEYLQEYSAKEPLFDNIIDALKIDGKAYVAPATVHLPMFIGEKDVLSELTDLGKVAEMTQQLREEHPGDDIIGICSAKGVMNRFAAVSAPMWLAENGSLNREIIGSFLEQCKRIYDAQMDGIRADIVADYESMDDYYRNSNAESGMWRVDWTVASDIFDYIGGETYLLSGWLNNPNAYNECISLEMAKGYENSGYGDMSGHCTRIFKANTLLGISAVSAQPDAAKAFMDFFLSAEAQAAYYSFPLNKEAYDIQFTPDEKYLGHYDEGPRSYGVLVLSTAEGTFVEFEVYYASDGQIAELKEKIASLTTPYLHDNVLEDAVFEKGAGYIEGDLTLEEALTEIEKQVAIYMAE